MKNYFNHILFGVISSIIATTIFANNDMIKLFPIENYSQNVNQWINPFANNYTTNLLDEDYQQQRLIELKHTYYGTTSGDNSPWSESHVLFVFSSQSESKSILLGIKSSLADFDNQHQDDKHTSYGMNYRPYSVSWWNKIAANTNLLQFRHLSYDKNNRAIAITNLAMRGLPTADPAFYSYKIAGEGYPFDNLSLSALYAGTPVYILGISKDQQWNLVMAPEYIGWVKADGLALVDDKFINIWQHAAYKNIAGITDSNVSIIDAKSGNYQFSGYVGMIFPVMQYKDNIIKVLIPEKLPNGMAVIATANLSNINSAVLPLAATPANFARLFKALQGRQYGWGSMGFYTDCSAEMKSIYTMFGLFMPRNSKHQRDAGKVVDISDLSNKDRLNYLIKNGNPLFTLVRLKGHILMYIGTYKYPDGREVAMSYQQIWGLAPKDRNMRSVLGQSVFLPLLLSYPEDPDVVSELDNSLFELIYLDQYSGYSLKYGISELMY